MLIQILREPVRCFSNPGISVTVMISAYQSILQPPQTVEHTLVENLNLLTHYKCLGFITAMKTNPPFMHL